MGKALCGFHILGSPVGFTPFFTKSDSFPCSLYRDVAGINRDNFRKVWGSGGHQCHALFCTLWLEGVVQSKIKTSSFIGKHSWAVWSLSPRVIGVYTACGIRAWAARLCPQSPRQTCLGHHLPLARSSLYSGFCLDTGVVSELRKRHCGDSKWKTCCLLLGTQK